MQALLDVTAEDISNLDDGALRKLVGRLCEADFRKAGCPTAGITWGGNQDAADGGFDVVVNCDFDPPVDSIIKTKRCNFQVKRSDMARSDIIREMRPNGTLRPGIVELMRASGSYIIVSSNSSVANLAFQSRKAAMLEAIMSKPDHPKLYLDFFDQNRIATWVRNHPFMMLWVRHLVGRPLVGWRPFESWSQSDGLADEYLVDTGLRLQDGLRAGNEGLSVADGIARLRNVLASPGSSVRLAGLSGVGKTRLVQALFDGRVGTANLDPSWAFYTDLADSPYPDPRTLAEQLIAIGTRAVLIVARIPQVD